MVNDGCSYIVLSHWSILVGAADDVNDEYKKTHTGRGTTIKKMYRYPATEHLQQTKLQLTNNL